MVSCMGSLWVALSFILSLILGFSLMSSAWFKNNNTSFGVFVQCSGEINSPCNQTCIAFRTLEEIPDVSWKISAVILFAGWLLLSFGALLVLSWTVIPAGLCQRRVCTPARHTQIIAGLSFPILYKQLIHVNGYCVLLTFICDGSVGILNRVKFTADYFRSLGSTMGHLVISSLSMVVTIFGLLLFPVSLHSTFAKQICNSSLSYRSGSCSLGWGYMMAIITVMLSCFLPIIGRYNINEMKTKILRSKLTQRMLVCEEHMY